MQQKLKAPFRKLRNFGLSKQGSKEAPAAIDDEPLPSVSKCMQDASDLRNKYEGLLANGQIISGAAYDFARSFEYMASYMMETFGEVVDEEIGNVFSLLAKVQFEMAKLLDLFAAHVSQTIIKPTESLMKKIQQAEIMKNRYDEERRLYVLSLMQKKLSKAKRGKGSSNDKNFVANEKSLQEKVNLLTTYVQSLAGTQLENLLTQGVQYHSALMHLFSKGFGSVNAVEPMIGQVALSRMIDTTLSEEEMSIKDFIDSSEMMTKEDAQKYDSHSDSVASSPRHLLVEQTEPPRYLSDSSDEFCQRRPVVTSKSAPISPLMYHRKEAMGNAQVSALVNEHESVTMYALPSPLQESGGLIGIKSIKKLEKRLESFSKHVENTSGGKPEAPRARPSSVNGLSPKREQAVRIQQDRPGAKCFPNKDLNLSVNCSNEDDSNRPIESKARRYTQSGPLIESPSSIKHASQDGRVAPTSLYEELVPPLYKSGPIRRSPHFSGIICDQAPLPPSMPHISELHKLPLPPPGYVTPPKSPNNMPTTVTHSAPLANSKWLGFGKPAEVTPSVSLSPSMMVRSLSIPAPIIQLED